MKKTFIVFTSLVVVFIFCSSNANSPLAPEPDQTIYDQWHCCLPDPETGLTSQDRISAINRWISDLYPHTTMPSQAYMLAFLLDPVLKNYAENLRPHFNAAGSPDEKMAILDAWTSTALCHTQFQPVFQSLPGKDPWGLLGPDQGPTFKKLLPSEMAAMSVYTGLVSGKCITLCNFVTSLMIHLGIPARDMVHLLLVDGDFRHGLALVKFNNRIYLVNNNRIVPFVVATGGKAVPQPYHVVGLYNHEKIINTPFEIPANTISEDLLLSDSPLMATFLQRFEIDNEKINCEFKLDDMDVNHLDKAIFESLLSDPVAQLTRYASQSLAVRDPQSYCKASLLGSRTLDLSNQLNTPDEIINWVKTNIKNGSIFQESHPRIMTSDQTIVFQTGGTFDKAMLVWTLLSHAGYEVDLHLSEHDAFLRWDTLWLRVSDWQYGEKTPDVYLDMRQTLSHI